MPGMKMRSITAAALLMAAVPACAQGDAAPLRPSLERLAEEGNAEALYHLGMIAHLGLNGEQEDAARALLLFRQSAERGDPLGAYKLGCFYAGQGGDVIEANPELALRYKLVAAEAGYALAQNDVAQIYFQQGDVETALRWLQAAADQGDLGSMMVFATLHGGEAGIPKDGARQYAYLKLAMQRMETVAEGLPVGWEAEARSGFSADELRRGDEIAAAWQARPTALTLKADLGQQAAERLVAAN